MTASFAPCSMPGDTLLGKTLPRNQDHPLPSVRSRLTAAVWACTDRHLIWCIAPHLIHRQTASSICHETIPTRHTSAGLISRLPIRPETSTGTFGCLSCRYICEKSWRGKALIQRYGPKILSHGAVRARHHAGVTPNKRCCSKTLIWVHSLAGFTTRAYKTLRASVNCCDSTSAVRYSYSKVSWL